jgi:signal recognition particle receptor subunit alpha
MLKTWKHLTSKYLTYYRSKKDEKSNNINLKNIKDQFFGEPEPDNLNEKELDTEKNSGIFSKFTSTLKNYIGNKTLTEEDLLPVMNNFMDLLMEKNVAKEIANNLCESVKQSLLKTKTESFTTITATVKEALKETIARILTPKQELDILKQALSAKKRGEPFKIVFIGVNG